MAWSRKTASHHLFRRYGLVTCGNRNLWSTNRPTTRMPIDSNYLSKYYLIYFGMRPNARLFRLAEKFFSNFGLFFVPHHHQPIDDFIYRNFQTLSVNTFSFCFFSFFVFVFFFFWSSTDKYSKQVYLHRKSSCSLLHNKWIKSKKFAHKNAGDFLVGTQETKQRHTTNRMKETQRAKKKSIS